MEGDDTIVTTGPLNYEEREEYIVTVNATDNEGLSTYKDFTLRVT